MKIFLEFKSCAKASITENIIFLVLKSRALIISMIILEPCLIHSKTKRINFNNTFYSRCTEKKSKLEQNSTT